MNKRTEAAAFSDSFFQRMLDDQRPIPLAEDYIKYYSLRHPNK